MANRRCSIPECDWKPTRPSHRFRIGLCPTHYQAQRIAGLVCKEGGCRKPAKAPSGWCWGHYERWRQYGDPHAPVAWHAGESPQERILKRVEVVDGCWEWTGYVGDNGYGSGSGDWAHRESYRAFVGEIPEGLDLDHLCRNRRCVNPDHLEPVTRQENLRRSPLVGRTRS